MNDRKNHFKYLITKYQINKGLLEDINIHIANSALNDSVLKYSSLILTGAIALDMLKVLKEHMIYFFNNHHVQFNDKEHLELKELYDEYTDKLSNYLKNDDPINIGVNFTKMLWEDELSYNKFEFNNGDVKRTDSNNVEMLGLRVILGEAVCRNISALLVDIYKKLGYDSEMILVKAYNKNLKERITTAFIPLNHVVALVKKDDKNIIIDPTNTTIGILNRDKKRTQKVISMIGDETNLKYKFVATLDDSIVVDIKDDYLIQNYDNLIIDNEYVQNLEIKSNIEFKEKNKELIKHIFDKSKNI